MEFSANILETFKTEAKELLTNMEEILLKIEAGDESIDLINDLFRNIHTFKGSAGMFGFTELSGFVHEVESYLDNVRNNKIIISKNKAQVFLQIIDYLDNLLQASINKNLDSNLIAKKDLLLEQLNTLANNNINNINNNKKYNIINSIKIDPQKLDNIINLIGEIIIVQEYINNLIKKNNNKLLLDRSEHLYELLNNLKDLSINLRMLPVREIFYKFNRVVRDIATQQNKQIKLQIIGEDTELDKIIIEKIQDPLLHLIRNACDHGIDSKEERKALNKAECGLISLEAYQENKEVIIKISDDGRGISKENLTHIFEPGFSTSKEVTDISGRGVGMDVVKQEIEKLHGSLDINTTLNIGTTFTLRLPLSLAIIDGLLIKINKFLGIIPMWNIVECMDITLEHYNLIKKDKYFNYRDNIIPVLLLHELLELQEDFATILIVVQHLKYKIGIVVPIIEGTVQTVIKPVPAILNKLSWINGTAILGNGKIAIILDIPGLINNLVPTYE